ncbi:MAG TPA: hypothetical protein VG935_02180, partial [Patescibacteria group bacterium]|nr:hypothetical protein [Patescibacteria group bacterium]
MSVVENSFTAERLKWEKALDDNRYRHGRHLIDYVYSDLGSLPKVRISGDFSEGKVNENMLQVKFYNVSDCIRTAIITALSIKGGSDFSAYSSVIKSFCDKAPMPSDLSVVAKGRQRNLRIDVDENYGSNYRFLLSAELSCNIDITYKTGWTGQYAE